jgi:hypothetical protein
VLRPKYGLEDERDEDIFGIVLCAIVLVCPKFAGGRGTDRDIDEDEGAIAPDLDDIAGLLTPRLDIAEFPMLCGGRGTDRPAGCGVDLAPLDSGPRFPAAVVVPRPVFCEAVNLEALAGGVILLTVGLEATPAPGLALAVDPPSTLERVGDAFGRPILELDRFRKAPFEMLARLPATGSPCSRVFRETAVMPVALA